MKRFITLIVSACAFFAASAQFPMVTLSHNGELSFFTNVSAFEDAIQAAEDGDVLYLSEGAFTATTDTVTVKKRLSIQGTGYKSRLSCHLKFDINTSSSDESTLNLVDGMSLRTLSFGRNASSRSNVKHALISKCKIEKLFNTGFSGENVLVDRCDIGYLDANGAGESNVTVKNSKIRDVAFTASYSLDGDISYITVINCNFKIVHYLPKTTISSILGSRDHYNEYARKRGRPVIIKSLHYSSMPSEAEIYDCYKSAVTFDEDLNCTNDLTNYKGQDDTVVGIDGGDTPFSENPSVPTVDTANSSVEYDSSANKLKVTIAVKAD